MAYNLAAEMFSEWAIGTVVIAIRLYARWKVGKGQFQWDDFLLVFAVVCFAYLLEYGMLTGADMKPDFLDYAHCLSLPMHMLVGSSHARLMPTHPETAVHKSNIGLNEKTAMEIPDELVPDYRSGSIDAFIAWISYITTVWAFKGVLMFLYNRMTYVLQTIV